MTTLYRARWVLPRSSEAIEDGAVAVRDAEVIAVGAGDALASRFPGARVEDFGSAVILPGLVNCHTHLELTAMRGYLEAEEGNFLAWLKKLTLARTFRMSEEDLYVSAAWGAVEAARAGITCVGDACSAATHSMRALRDVGLRGVVYQEVFGPDARMAREQFERLREQVEGLRGGETELVSVGVSPHAPYTVSAPLIRLVADYARAENLPVMMHAAESHDESLLLLEGRGIFADNLRERGIEWHAPGVSPVQYLARLGLLDARTLLAHCVRVDAGDIETLRASGAGVAHCPKSNAKLGHGRAPFAAFLDAGLKVGLGSDSVGSNNTCDMLEEARFATLLSRASCDTLADGRTLDARDALRAATEGGARALDIAGASGVIGEGAQADLCVVSLDGTHQLPTYDPARTLVFSSTGRDVLLTMVAGREIFRDGRVQTLDEDALRLRVQDLARRLSQD